METREKVLKVALEVFSEKGTAGSSMREIAGLAGVNIATVYHHFGSKQGLFQAVCELGSVSALENWREFFPPELLDAGAQPVLEQILAGTWALMALDAEFIRLATLEALRGDKDARSAGLKFRDEGQRVLEEVLRETNLADNNTSPLYALLLREIIWGTFLEFLMLGEPKVEDLQVRAEKMAAVLARILEKQ